MENPVDDFSSAEEREAQRKLDLLNERAHEGALFADWSRSYCSKKLFGWLDEQIQDTKNNWLAAESREKAEAIRLQAQSYTKIKNWILAKVRAGEVAAEGVKQFHDEGVELEGMIHPPTGK